MTSTACCEPFHPLDRLLGMECRVLCLPRPLASGVKKPRERHFIVREIAHHACLDNGAYTLALLVKRGFDTLSALSILASLLGVPADSLGYAGLKDANATTLQYITIPGHWYKVILKSLPKDRLLVLKPICMVKKPIRRGMLKGNEFVIVLEGAEEVKNLRDLMAELASLLASKPLPNYFGYQRFGTTRPSTHLVGYYASQAMLGSMIEEVISSPYPDESSENIKRRLERSLASGYEAKIIRQLRALGLETLRKLAPKSLRELFASALQAYLFNRYLSLRLKMGYGLQEAIPGEVVRGDDVYAPLISETCKLKGKVRELYEEVLLEEGITWTSLRMVMRALSVTQRCVLRPISFRVRNLRIMFKGENLVLSFTLPPGSYATVVLREIVSNPLEFT